MNNYNDIIASIWLDCATTSQEARDGDGNNGANHGQVAQFVNTPY